MTKQNSNVIQVILTSQKVEEIKAKVDEGYKITRQEKYWHEDNPLTKRKGVVFTLSDEETMEYIKCKMGIDINDEPYLDDKTQTMKMTGIEYFAEKYCKIKNELGQISNIRLRDYQQDILNMFMENRFSIIIASRQIGKCFLSDTEVVMVELGVKSSSKIYQLWFNTLKNKHFIDYIKYTIYKIISFIK